MTKHYIFFLEKDLMKLSSPVYSPPPYNSLSPPTVLLCILSPYSSLAPSNDRYFQLLFHYQVNSVVSFYGHSILLALLPCSLLQVDSFGPFLLGVQAIKTYLLHHRRSGIPPLPALPLSTNRQTRKMNTCTPTAIYLQDLQG